MEPFMTLPSSQTYMYDTRLFPMEHIRIQWLYAHPSNTPTWSMFETASFSFSLLSNSPSNRARMRADSAMSRRPTPTNVHPVE